MGAFCWSQMPSPTSTSISKFVSDHVYLSMLEKQCNTMKDLRKIHAQLIKSGLVKDPIAASRVLAFSASPAGDINYAYLVFTRIRSPNLFIWNTIIRGFSRSSTPQVAISLFIDMLVTSSVEPQRLTYPSVFKAYAQLGMADYGAQLHGRVVKLGLEFDRFIRNTIIYMYANCGFLSEARQVFDEDMEFDLVAWNSMIMGLAKCEEIDNARKLFDKMLERNTISWNSMISGYVRNGKFKEALELFGEMQQEIIRPSEFTMVSLLNACARLGAIRQGEWLHAFLRKNNFELNSIVVTAIIDMYCKCGCPVNALRVFESVSKKGLSCWNSMILGLATNGYENEAIELFSKLESSSNLKPDDVSFIGVLTACSHSGMVDKAKEYFRSMAEAYKIKPSIKHYSCMVDVLGRAGLIEEAEELVRRMPLNPDAVIFGSLLSAACNMKHGNVDLAKQAAIAKRITELDKNESCSYVLMSNLYAASHQFEEAMEERLSMKEKKIEKEPGCSLIEVNGEVHEFVAGGRLHPKTEKIYSLLNELRLQLKEI